MKGLKRDEKGGLRAAFLLGWPGAVAEPVQAAWLAGVGFLGQGNPLYPGSPSGDRGRLVINYPVLLTVLLVLVLAAVLAVGLFLYYWFSRREGSLESRLTSLEHSIQSLYQQQQGDLDGLLKLLQSTSGKNREEPTEKPDLEEDTCVKKKDKG
ncbi:MAG: hypothetical protein HY892_06800 [Deltaproteobacteria bacterium]|nr:hypothetical protein [Deltaproteobacteria bacterium]